MIKDVTMKTYSWCFKCKKYKESKEFIDNAELQYCKKCRTNKDKTTYNVKRKL